MDTTLDAYPRASAWTQSRGGLHQKGCICACWQGTGNHCLAYQIEFISFGIVLMCDRVFIGTLQLIFILCQSTITASIATASLLCTIRHLTNAWHITKFFNLKLTLFTRHVSCFYHSILNTLLQHEPISLHYKRRLNCKKQPVHSTNGGFLSMHAGGPLLSCCTKVVQKISSALVAHYECKYSSTGTCAYIHVC